MMLFVENRESNDERSLGELFTFLMKCLTLHGYRLIVASNVHVTLLADNLDIADDEITALVDAFMDAIPTLLKTKLQAA